MPLTQCSLNELKRHIRALEVKIFKNGNVREVNGSPPAGQLAYTQPFQILSKEGVSMSGVLGDLRINSNFDMFLWIFSTQGESDARDCAKEQTEWWPKSRKQGTFFCLLRQQSAN